MLGREVEPIEIIDSNPRERNFCYIAPLSVGKSLTVILDLEKKLSEGNLSQTQWEKLIHRHIVEWGRLPDYYKSELCDADNIAF